MRAIVRVVSGWATHYDPAMNRLLAIGVLGLGSLAFAGCGGSGGASDNRPKVGGQLIGGVLNCLYDDNWLAQPGDADQIIGTSDGGVTFALTFYPTPEDAKKKVGKGEVIDNAVVKYNVSSFQQAGGNESDKVTPTTESATIKKCIDQANS
jgi:hypothetical protein